MSHAVVTNRFLKSHDVLEESEFQQCNHENVSENWWCSCSQSSKPHKKHLKESLCQGLAKLKSDFSSDIRNQLSGKAY